jgi:hypothetical protein
MPIGEMPSSDASLHITIPIHLYNNEATGVPPSFPDVSCCLSMKWGAHWLSNLEFGGTIYHREGNDFPVVGHHIMDSFLFFGT